ncbi:putative secreted protein [Streptomyces ambofaciens ATCC 23877]|uniref:Putative secreted protein n=1 Tax=Streptomyces ambofaciens (strain ATCC 23877 / 3486 / DSM 40053 / JCM 4204 / NBRC 12836 / NRRL B-2516) TaxID=278992 RepID=A0A0K2B240_STRA7|nr:hypothetical protein [Streptomyces ambofaciens]AKZ59273.1 putative secreted protein [Streptomyces ambofaciens ATCC 23877]
MRRTARALSAAVLAGAALGVFTGAASAEPGAPLPPAEPGVPSPPAAPGVPSPPATPGVPARPAAPSAPEAPSAPDARSGSSAASGGPVAEVSPADAVPGGTVTVSVSCAPTGAPAPATLDATSPAFEEGTVALRKVPGVAGTTSGPAYRGTARIAVAKDAEGSGATGDTGATEDAAATEDVEQVPDAPDAPLAPEIPDAADTEDAWTVDGACPEESGGEGDPWSATITAPEPGEEGAAVAPPCPEPAPRGEAPAHGRAPAPGASCAPEPACPEPAAPHGEASARKEPCAGPAAEHGVRAGAGGAFSDSVPALVAGGVLIAGAGAAAAHRLRLRLRGDAEQH